MSALQFRPLAEEDLPLMKDWLNSPHLQTWWRQGMLTLKEVHRKYLPRISGQDDARPYLVLENEEPVGFIQYYLVEAGKGEWWPDECGENVIGIDLFIGAEENTGQGLGTRILREFISFVRTIVPVREIRVDPNPENHRAIRCYEKAGFTRGVSFKSPDGPAILMTATVTPDQSFL